MFDNDGTGLWASKTVEKEFDGLRDRYGVELHDLDGIGLYESDGELNGNVH